MNFVPALFVTTDRLMTVDTAEYGAQEVFRSCDDGEIDLLKPPLASRRYIFIGVKEHHGSILPVYKEVCEP